MGEDERYSGVVRELKSQFNNFKEQGYSSLFVCANPWGALPLLYVPVPSNIWPWAVFDDDQTRNLSEATDPIIAFDLKGVFEDQMPTHYRQIEMVDCFLVSPLIHIPDRAGIVPAQEQAKFHAKALRRTDHLKLVK